MASHSGSRDPNSPRGQELPPLEARLTELRYRTQMRARMRRRAWKRLLILLGLAVCVGLILRHFGDQLGSYYARQREALRQHVRGVKQFGKKVKERPSASGLPDEGKEPGAAPAAP